MTLHNTTRTLLAATMLAGVGLASAGSALAADLLPPPVPSGGGYGGGMSCLYTRVDGGASFNSGLDWVRIEGTPAAGDGFGPALDAQGANNPKLSSTGLVQGGIGCQVNDLLRVEAVGGYMFKRSLTDDDGTLSADVDSYLMLFNAYWDLTNYGGFTPYIGGGAGLAVNSVYNVNDPAAASAGSTASFAWNFAAGMSYDLSQNWKIDVSYRYLDMGQVELGGSGNFQLSGIADNQIMVGIRYNFWTW